MTRRRCSFLYDLGREQRLDKYDLAHATVREILTEMKDISEIMVDLAYASIMFDSEEIAEEVKNLEEDMEELSKNIRIKAMLSARTHKDATKLSSLLEVAAASRRISNAAGDIVKLMECEVDKRPFLTFILREAEEKIKRLVLSDVSDMVGRQIGDLGWNRKRECASSPSSAGSVGSTTRRKRPAEGRGHPDRARH